MKANIRHGPTEVRSPFFDVRMESGDVLQIETQYDATRKTVLYVHINGETVLRVQGLNEGSQIANVKNGEVVPYTIEMEANS